MVETRVESIRVSLVTQNRAVILKDVEAERYLAVWIDAYVAEAIAMELQGVIAPRPMTHDLLRNVIGELGGTVTHVLISDLRDGIYYARVVLDAGGRHVEVDSRSSDAIALAVRVGVPIFIEDEVMMREGVVPDNRPALNRPSDDYGLSSRGPDEPATETPSVFRDFINSLDFDDLGKDKQS